MNFLRNRVKKRPILSYGIIAYQVQKDKSLKYLMIQRKNSLSYCEFVKLRYNIEDVEYMRKILKNITKEEKDFLEKTKSSKEIWKKLWTIKSNVKEKDFYKVKSLLDKLLKGFYVKNKSTKQTEYVSVETLAKEVKHPRESTEWGFPKGRRNKKEKDIECALREFYEETNIDQKEIELHKELGFVSETFCGSNDVLYRHIYYIGKIISEIDIGLDSKNLEQASEVSSISWCAEEEVIKNLEEKNKNRIKMFKKACKLIEKKNKTQSPLNLTKEFFELPEKIKEKSKEDQCTHNK